MKNGLIFENGELIYYENDEPKHAGVVQIDGDIYYISSNGRAVTGRHIVHRSMSNGILKRGTYKFGDDYKLIEGSYIAPKSRKHHSSHHHSRHSSSHRSSHGHSRRRSRSKRSKKKLLRILLPVVLLFGLIGGVIIWEAHHNNQNAPVTDGKLTETAMQLQVSLPTFDDEVLLCSSAVKKAYDHIIPVSSVGSPDTLYQPFVFRYSLLSTSGTLQLSDNPGFYNAQTYELDSRNSSVIIDNLKVATTYYYRVLVDDQKYEGTFKTAQSSRFVTIPGVSNTRDIGGYTTLDGKTVKQGMLVRGTEIDGLVVPSYYLPVRSRNEVQATFGFVYDFDLRETNLYTGSYQSPLGAGVGHKFYRSPQYGQIFNANWVASLRDIFSDLADPDKYPMYMHCTWGKDRTGTIIFLLQGVLNMSLEDMNYEYLLSAPNDTVFIEAGYMDAVTLGLEAYEGDTIQEKIVNFLTTFVGVTENEIESIRNILLSE